MPLNKDWAFILWVSISGLASLSVFGTNLSNGAIGVFSGPGLISGLLDAIFTVVGNLFIWYVISLIWLLPRRFLISKPRKKLESKEDEGDYKSSVENGFKINGRFSLSNFNVKKIILALLLVLLLFGTDQVIQNFEMSKILKNIERSEKAMLASIRDERAIKREHWNGTTWDNFAYVERLYSASAKENSGEIYVSGQEINRLRLMPWHIDIKNAKNDYLKHNQAWTNYLETVAEIDGEQLWSESDSQAISNTWDLLQVSLPKAIPLFDAGDFEARVESVLSN